MTEAASIRRRSGTLDRLGSLALWLELGLGLRVLAADAVEWYVRRRGPTALCVFADTEIYWTLAQRIRAGAPYEVSAYRDLPHFALRTPGYPLFLAGCQALFGERTLPVRLVQAALGTVCIWLAYRLVRQILPDSERIALIAAALVAVEPFTVGMSALLLSEAL